MEAVEFLPIQAIKMLFNFYSTSIQKIDVSRHYFDKSKC